MWRLLVAAAFSAVPLLALPATDGFSRCAATIGSAWTTTVQGAVNTAWATSDNAGACGGSPVGLVSANSGSEYALSYWNGDSFADDQYAQAVITKGASGYEGVAVRITTNSGYLVTLETSTCNIRKIVSNTRSDIGSCTVTWTNGHTLYMEATGVNPTSIVVKDGGSGGTTIGTASDSDLDSGSAGVAGYSDTGGNWTAWEGGNVGGGGGPVYPFAIRINHPIRCCR